MRCNAPEGSELPDVGGHGSAVALAVGEQGEPDRARAGGIAGPRRFLRRSHRGEAASEGIVAAPCGSLAATFGIHAMIHNRRPFLRSAVAGSLLMPAILHELLAGDAPADPLAPRPAHFPARAQRVIFLFMSGGVSHVDSFDPKPKLVRDHGRTVTLDHPETRNRPGYERLFLKRPQWTFHQHGQSGTEVSTLFPHVARCVDDLCVIRSMHGDHSNHYNATLGMHTGSFN